MMRSLLALFAVGSASAAESGKVVELTDADFHAKIEEGKPVFIKFYAPWCGHCKRLAPDWDKLAESLVDEEMVIAKVDCTVESKTAGVMKVRGYPTLQVVHGDKLYEHNGPRSLEALEKYAKGGWKETPFKNVPWNESFVDVAKEYAVDYLQKISQIMAFEPTLLPLMFFLGCCTTFFIQWIMGWNGPSQAPAPVAAKKEGKKDD